jgi:hypothetical protein
VAAGEASSPPPVKPADAEGSCINVEERFRAVIAGRTGAAVDGGFVAELAFVGGDIAVNELLAEANGVFLGEETDTEEEDDVEKKSGLLPSAGAEDTVPEENLGEVGLEDALLFDPTTRTVI